MKRTPMPGRAVPMGRATAPRPARGPARDWSEVNEKMAREGHRCRVGADNVGDGSCAGPVQRAHVLGREYDEPHPTRAGMLLVRAVDVVPLCRHHHQLYDARRLDLLPYLTPAEQARAVLLAEGIISALVRITSRAGLLL